MIKKKFILLFVFTSYTCSQELDYYLALLDNQLSQLSTIVKSKPRISQPIVQPGKALEEARALLPGSLQPFLTELAPLVTRKLAPVNPHAQPVQVYDLQQKAENLKLEKQFIEELNKRSKLAVTYVPQEAPLHSANSVLFFYNVEKVTPETKKDALQKLAAAMAHVDNKIENIFLIFLNKTTPGQLYLEHVFDDIQEKALLEMRHIFILDTYHQFGFLTQISDQAILVVAGYFNLRGQLAPQEQPRPVTQPMPQPSRARQPFVKPAPGQHIQVSILGTGDFEGMERKVVEMIGLGGRADFVSGSAQLPAANSALFFYRLPEREGDPEVQNNILKLLQTRDANIENRFVILMKHTPESKIESFSPEQVQKLAQDHIYVFHIIFTRGEIPNNQQNQEEISRLASYFGGHFNLREQPVPTSHEQPKVQQPVEQPRPIAQPISQPSRHQQPFAKPAPGQHIQATILGTGDFEGMERKVVEMIGLGGRADFVSGAQLQPANSALFFYRLPEREGDPEIQRHILNLLQTRDANIENRFVILMKHTPESKIESFSPEQVQKLAQDHIYVFHIIFMRGEIPNYPQNQAEISRLASYFK